MIHYFFYLIEVSICLVLFYMIYLLLIENDTFHKLKRYYLLLSVSISLIIPVLPSTDLTKDIEKTIISQKVETVSNTLPRDSFEKVVFVGISKQTVFKYDEKMPVPILPVLFFIYVLGAGFMFIRFMNNFYRIYEILKRNEHIPYRKYIIIPLVNDYPTFSFFRYIFLNDNTLSINDKNDILYHEEIHIKQGHSFDTLFIEICKIFLWFNPVIWQYKISLSKVHECLADESIVELKSDNILDYKSLLLKQYLSDIKIELAHPFNYTLIKFRLNMMTKIKSKWWAKYKLIFAIPVIILSLLAFTNDRVILSSTEFAIMKNFQGFNGPIGWFKAGDQPASYKLYFDNQIFQHGQKSAHIESLVDNPAGFCTLMQYSVVKKFKGKRVKMTGYIKSQGLNDTTTMWLRIDDYNKKISSEFDNMFNRPIIGNKDWTKCEIVFDVPDSECMINYGVILKGAGKTWFDNISFEIINSSGNKTTHNIDQALPSEYVRQFGQLTHGFPEKSPVNLDFEE